VPKGFGLRKIPLILTRNHTRLRKMPTKRSDDSRVF
jgi:hypothetical protein